jgi:UDP-N-acetylmuramoyl-L-alanyl-D-glutamate--2,6-diaminopimelate ligase
VKPTLASPIPKALRSLLASIPPDHLRISGEAEVDHASQDSREIGPGGLFVATRGSSWDGHSFIGRALEAGATAIIAETPRPEALSPGVAWVEVLAPANAMLVLAHLAAAWFEHPGRTVKVLATTGTNGKTTTTYLLREILRRCGHRSGLISTVEILVDQDKRPTLFTTPPSPEFQSLLAEIRDAGCAFAVVEASSHGLHQHRIAAFDVAVGGFTNLTRDHLDYHGDMASYEGAKALLFDALAAAACINIDDPAGTRFADRFGAPSRLITVSPSGASAHLSARAVSSTLMGLTATVDIAPGTVGCHGVTQVELALPLIGRHNLENALVALGMALLAGLHLGDIVSALSEARGAPGRLQRVDGPGPAVFVDYAHTPDALANVLTALRPLVHAAGGRLLCVFGAGGDRDKGKRPEMAQMSARHADLVVITSDNPRTESPEAILDDIAAGFPPDFAFTRLVDRRAAIAHAIGLASPKDAVLIAGKGHEDYQIIGTTKTHFDDVTVAREALAGGPR